MSKQKLLIVGGGYAGLQTALYINRDLYDVTLLDMRPYHDILPETPHIISDSSTVTTVPFVELLRNTAVQFVQGKAQKLDTVSKKLYISDADALSYDIIIFALGAETNYFGITGLEEYSMPYTTTEQAQTVIQHIESSFAKAQSLGEGHADYDALVSIVIGGGGLTGVEVAGEYLHILPDLIQKYNINPDKARIYLVEGMDTLLPAVPAEDRLLSQRVTNFFTDRPELELVLSEFITEAHAGHIVLRSGRIIKSHNVLWTGGVRGNKFFDMPYIGAGQQEMPWVTQRGMRVVVDKNYQAEGLEDVYVIGDASWAVDPDTQVPYAQTGQIAYKQGREIAKYLNTSKSISPKAVHSQGILASLGPDIGAGLADMGLKVHLPVNFIARFIKRLIEGRYKIFNIRK